MPDMPVVRPFGVRFSEAIDFLSAKLPERSLRHDDLAGPVHAKVFAIAGATNIDLVNDIHTSLKNALANGTTLTQFRKDFDQAVQKHGWTYNGKRGWRTAVIFNTNMRTAHMAGRWQQLQANKANRPFLQYRTAGDARVRPQHRQWNGLVFHIDNAFWQTHYPPNGWGCRCTIRAYGGDEMAEKGLSESPKFEGKTRTVTGKDGQTKDVVPVGIDPGWDHNVGQSWISPEQALGQKIAALPLELKGALVARSISPAFQKVMNTSWQRFFKLDKKLNHKLPQAQIVGFLDAETLKAIADQVPSLQLQSTAATVFDFKTVHLAGGHKAEGSPKQVWPDEWSSTLPERLSNYRAVLWDLEKPGLVVLPQGEFNDWAPYVVLGALNAKAEGLNWAQPAVLSLGARPAREWGTKFKLNGELVERYLTLIGRKP